MKLHISAVCDKNIQTTFAKNNPRDVQSCLWSAGERLLTDTIQIHQLLLGNVLLTLQNKGRLVLLLLYTSIISELIKMLCPTSNQYQFFFVLHLSLQHPPNSLLFLFTLFSIAVLYVKDELNARGKGLKKLLFGEDKFWHFSSHPGIGIPYHRVQSSLGDPLMVLPITTAISVLNKSHIMKSAITRLSQDRYGKV